MTQTNLTVNSATNQFTGGFSYDASGNLYNDGLHTYQYDGENRPVSMDGNAATYVYDGSGLRVQKTENGTTTVYLFSGTKVIAEYDAGSTTPNVQYLYSGGSLLAKIAGSSLVYAFEDQLSGRVEYDATGLPKRTFGHLPFGDTWYETGTASQWKFTSYERDSSGLDYAMFRYYSSRLGRFTIPDPAGNEVANAVNPQTWNRYVYVINSPITLMDPLGLDGMCDQLGNCTVENGPVVPNELPYNSGIGGSPWSRGGTGQLCRGGWRCSAVLDDGTQDRLAQALACKGDPSCRVRGLVDAANNKPSDCRYVDPFFAGVELTGKFGPAIEVGDFNLGASVKKTLGDDAATEAVAGFKGLISIQRTNDNVWASTGQRYSVTLFGFNKQVDPNNLMSLFSKSGWTFNPSKEFKGGLQALVGFEVGWNSEKFAQAVKQNQACGYYDHN